MHPWPLTLEHPLTLLCCRVRVSDRKCVIFGCGGELLFLSLLFVANSVLSKGQGQQPGTARGRGKIHDYHSDTHIPHTYIDTHHSSLFATYINCTIDHIYELLFSVTHRPFCFPISTRSYQGGERGRSDCVNREWYPPVCLLKRRELVKMKRLLSKFLPKVCCYKEVT